MTNETQLDTLRGTILTVDDSPTIRKLVSMTMEGQGYRVVAASDGIEALAILKDESPDLILCDVQMPGMDGFEVAQKIVQHGAATNTLMMLSSSNLGQDLERAQLLGLGGYLVKPIKRADLFNAIRQVQALPVASNPVAAEAEPPEQSTESDTGSKKRILLVEDNPDNRMLIQAYLKKQPYEIEEAEHGEQAVEMFRAANYDLVLMDVQMPIMDGHTATREIRRYEAERGKGPVTPIVALTAHAIKEEQDKSLAAGCTAHLTKPIKKQTLISTLEELLG